VASRGRHVRSTPKLPLATPEADPEKIVRRRKTPKEGTSVAEPGISDNFHHPPLETPILVSHSPVVPFAGVSKSLKFGSVPIDLSPPSLGLEGETFFTPVSPEIVPWFKPRTLEDFSTPGFTTPSPIRVIAFIEIQTYGPSSPVTFSLNTQSVPLSPRRTILVSLVQAPYPHGSPPAIITMVGENLPRNRMDAIVAAGYAPLVLPQPMNALPAGDYLKYMPKFTGEEDIISEEHLVSFYSYADNLNIEKEDVWMRALMVRLGNGLGD
jgi:hypothetical protein